MKRTHYCGELRESDIGQHVIVQGWIQTARDMGGVLFIDLKDREGILQTVFDRGNLSADDFAIAEGARNQSVVSVSGIIRLRDASTVNPKLATGTVELFADSITMLSQAEPLPYSLDDPKVREELRLKYRFLDLRRPQILDALRFRQKLARAAREYLDNDGFIEIETPMLCKSTPEGARDYLVPSRVHPGSFYALPQSPQIYKQLLMVGGIDRYYQVARCFRDEDLRADRQPEFTQVDMEMSFVEQEDMLVHLEKLFRYIFRKALDTELETPIPRITWHTAMDVYGSDKPDLRFDLPIVDLTDLAIKDSFSVFKNVAINGGVVRALNVKGKADFTRSEIEELTDTAMRAGAKGMAWIAIRPDGELYSIMTKYFTKSELDELITRVDGKPGDFILFCADTLATVRRTLGTLRLRIGDMLGLRDKNVFKLIFVTDFPQFEYSEEEGRFMAMHHPFTMPHPDDMQYLETDPARVRALAYDVVLNGIELGSGSIRIHDREIQQRMFKALGFGPEEIETRFGFMVNAFRYGTPPHGGFAFGLDRLAMQMIGADSLRDVIAFPKIRDASCPMTEAPTMVDEKQLEILKLNQPHTETATHQKRKANVGIDVRQIAELSRLQLTEDEQTSFAGELQAIVQFANQLNELDTEGVPVTAHVLPIDNVFHEDAVVPSRNRDELLANAPATREGMMFVPRTFA